MASLQRQRNACIMGTRMMVSVIPDHVASGLEPSPILHTRFAQLSPTKHCDVMNKISVISINRPIVLRQSLSLWANYGDSPSDFSGFCNCGYSMIDWRFNVGGTSNESFRGGKFDAKRASFIE